jgi:hypothetical protein
MMRFTHRNTIIHVITAVRPKPTLKDVVCVYCGLAAYNAFVIVTFEHSLSECVT